MMIQTYKRQFEGSAAALNDFDKEVLSNAIRILLNTDGTDDFPMIDQVEDSSRQVMAELKERLTTQPNTIELTVFGYQPTTLQTDKELALAIWSLETISNNEPPKKIAKTKIDALSALYNRLTD